MKICDIALINPRDKLKDNSFINYIDTSSVNDGKLQEIQHLTSNFPSRAQRVVKMNDILISSVRPNLKHNYMVNIDKDNLIASTGFIQIRCNSNKVLPQYVYYFLSSDKRTKMYSMIADSSQTTYPSFNKEVIESLELEDISIESQQHIVNTIGSVDDLIEKKQEIIVKLMDFSTSLYKNYLLSKGFMEKLGNCCSIKTGKLDANAADENGLYPFFTCSHNPLKINKYAFDCNAIIISGNGVIEVKYYEGKFNAYQRTYVLEPKKHLYLFLKQCEQSINNLRNDSQGSVIKFITKSMLEKISIIENEQSDEYDNKIKTIYNLISKVNKEIEKLSKIKSYLLQKYF